MMDEFEHGEHRRRWRASSSRAAGTPRWPSSPSCRAGTYRAEIGSDGYEKPLTLRAAMTVQRGGHHGRFRRHLGPVAARHQRARALYAGLRLLRHQGGGGAGRAQQLGLAWRRSRWTFPATASSTRRIPIRSPRATRPGQLLPDLMMGCLHQIVPDRVAAEGSSTLWNTPMRGGSAVSGQAEAGQAVLPDFEIITFHSGRHRRAAHAGRARRHGISLGRAHGSGRGDRECLAAA